MAEPTVSPAERGASDPIEEVSSESQQEPLSNARGPAILSRGHKWALLAFTLFFLWTGQPLLDGTGIPAWDAFNYYAPAYGLIADNARDGSLLLWNPLVGGGRPDGADPQVGAFSPLPIIIGLMTGGSPWGFMDYTLFLWWLGGAGFIFFARGLGVPAWAALVGAVAFTFSGFQTGHMSHTSVIYGMSFLPWILWRLDRALITRRFLPALQAGALWGLAGLAAYPAITILHGCVAACWALGRLIWRLGADPEEKQELASVGRSLVHSFLCLTLVCGVGLVVMAPAYIGFFVQFDGYDIRTGELPRSVATGSNALSVFGLTTASSPLITELLFINRKTLLKVTNSTSVSIYIAAPVLVLALTIVLVSARRGRERYWNWSLLAMALLALGLALGRDLPLRGWLYDYFPPSRYFRHAAKFRGYYIFFMLTLAMQFVRQWYRESEERFRATWSTLGLIALMGASVSIATLVVFSSVENGGPDLTRGIVVTLVIWIATAALAWLAPRYSRSSSTWLPCFLLILVGLDAWNSMHFSRRLVYFGSATRYRQVWDQAVTEYTGRLDSIAFSRDHKSRYWNHYNNLNSYAKVPAFESYGSYFSKTIRTWFESPILVEAASGENRTWFSESVAVSNFSPRAVDAFKKRVARLGEPPLVLAEDSCVINGSTTVAPIAEAPPARLLPIELLEYRQESLAFRVTVPADGWLMVTERFSPGWQLKVDDQQRSAPCPAGYIFRGIPLEKGEHLVEMTYRPWGHPWLLSISWGLLGGVLLWSVAESRRRLPRTALSES